MLSQSTFETATSGPQTSADVEAAIQYMIQEEGGDMNVERLQVREYKIYLNLKRPFL